MYFRCHLLPQRNIVLRTAYPIAAQAVRNSSSDYTTRDCDLASRCFCCAYHRLDGVNTKMSRYFARQVYIQSSAALKFRAIGCSAYKSDSFLISMHFAT
jgi:hypothetical protein